MKKTANIYGKIISDQSGNKIILKFYNKPIILKSIAFYGNEIFIKTKKVSMNDKGDYIVYDPIVVPFEPKNNFDLIYSQAGRKIPADLWRNAFYEFQCRYELSSKYY